jgi:hypothetical protein
MSDITRIDHDRMLDEQQRRADCHDLRERLDTGEVELSTAEQADHDQWQEKIDRLHRFGTDEQILGLNGVEEVQ